MGLFHRPTVAQPSEGHSFVTLIQNEGNNTGRGFIGWRDPRKDFNTHSKLIVRRGEEAIFENGGSEYVCFPPGEYELETQNYAVIRSFREALSGGQTMFPCRVYFVSTEQFEVEWGTSEAIGYTCPLMGPGAQVRGGGVYVIKVQDSEKFCGTILRDNESYDVDMLSKKLLSRIYKRVASIISNVLEENQINGMEVSKKVDEISELCMPRIQTLLDEFGFMLVDFTAELFIDEEQRQMYESAIRLQRMTAQGEAQARVISAQGKVGEMQTMGDAYTTIKGMEMLQTIAENPGAGGIASAGAGLGMGMAAGNAFGNIAQSIFSGVQQQPQQPKQSNFGGASRFGTGGQEQPTPSSASVPQDPIEVLEKMKQMLEKGLIPQAVYDQKVAEILSRM
ncbi:MAG: SPFH domain-containing protein [Bacteroidaceae bacterium]|nr:SPFH domain-containing protein [Bacteroidaceae bacterium]